MFKAKVMIAIDAEYMNIWTEERLLFGRYDIVLIGEYDGEIGFFGKGVEKSDRIDSSPFLPESGRNKGKASISASEP